jgi:hypothetical protein
MAGLRYALYTVVFKPRLEISVVLSVGSKKKKRVQDLTDSLLNSTRPLKKN